MFRAVGLQTHIWNNNLRSILLLVLYPLLFGLMVWAVVVLGASLMASHVNYGTSIDHGVTAGNRFIWEYWPTILTVIGVWFLVCWFAHTKMIRALSNSHPVTRQSEPELYNLLENLCISRGLKTPRLEIIEDSALNAFASGIDEKSYTITVTRGIMQALEKDELEAVLGHELTHIMNRDVRLLIVSIIFAGMVGFAAQLFWRMAFRTVGRTRSRDGRGLMVLLAIGLILWIGYIATMFTRFALSRRREFMADAGAVELTKSPEAMMRALQRISGQDRIEGATEDIALMCIENSHRFMGLFATHPPIENRIKAISDMTGEPVPELKPKGAADRASPWG